MGLFNFKSFEDVHPRLEISNNVGDHKQINDDCLTASKSCRCAGDVTALGHSSHD
jgi:hypothetical protein